MSIATEITRLQTTKADIKTAIESKGVTVPSNASIDTYNTYINQIQTGTEYIIYRDKKHYITGFDGNLSHNYFDLGFHWKNTLRLEGKLWYAFGSSSSWKRLFGNGTNSTISTNQLVQVAARSANSWGIYVNNTNTDISGIVNNAVNEFSWGQRGNSKMNFWIKNSSMDWTNKLEVNMQSRVPSTNMMLFNAWDAGSDTVWQLAYLQVFNAPNTNTWPATLIHEYYPAIRTSDGQCGLWDDVDQTFIAPIVTSGGHIGIIDHNA